VSENVCKHFREGTASDSETRFRLRWSWSRIREDKVFRNRNRDKIFFGVGAGVKKNSSRGPEKKLIFWIGVGIGIEKKIFSQSKSDFEIKKCGSADH